MNNDPIFEVTAVHAGSGSLVSRSVFVQASSEEVVRKYVEEELKSGNKSLDVTAWKLPGGCDGNICSKQHLFYISEVKPLFILDEKKNESQKSIVVVCSKDDPKQDSYLMEFETEDQRGKFINEILYYRMWGNMMWIKPIFITPEEMEKKLRGG